MWKYIKSRSLEHLQRYSAEMAKTILSNIHVSKDVDEILVDDANNIISTPAYMLARSLVEADEGISKLIAEVLRRAKAYKEAPASEDTVE